MPSNDFQNVVALFQAKPASILDRVVAWLLWRAPPQSDAVKGGEGVRAEGLPGKLLAAPFDGGVEGAPTQTPPRGRGVLGEGGLGASTANPVIENPATKTWKTDIVGAEFMDTLGGSTAEGPPITGRLPPRGDDKEFS